MIEQKNHAIVTLIYTLLLSWIYADEIVPVWSYMGFSGKLTLLTGSQAVAMTLPVAFLLRVERTAKSFMFISCFYLFFIPTAIYISLSGQGVINTLMYVMVIFIIIIITALKFEVPQFGNLNDRIFVNTLFSLIILVIGLQAFYGGLANFSLDIERVYEYRRESANNLPSIFAYVYSNVSSVLLPFMLVIAYLKKSYMQILVCILLTLLLFGMSHHKSVLFGPPVAVLLYIAFTNKKAYNIYPHIFIIIPLFSLIEVTYTRFFGQFDDIAYMTSLITRRVLFVPAMLDAKYIEFFSTNPVFYWSSSKLLSWAVSSYYNMTAPFIIGYEYFKDLDTSANTGIFGSGYSNARSLGVLLYAALLGVLLAFLNAVGRRIGHGFVAAVSFVTIFNILSSTDLLTAFLTHGLTLLIAILMLCSSSLTKPNTELAADR